MMKVRKGRPIRAALVHPHGRTGGSSIMRRKRRPGKTAMLRALYRQFYSRRISPSIRPPVSIPDIKLAQIIETAARLAHTTKQTVLTSKLKKATRAKHVVIYIALEYELCSVESLAQELGMAVGSIKSCYGDLKNTKGTRFADATKYNLIEQVERELGLTEIWS